VSEKKKLRDVDSAASAQKLQAAGWSAFGGVIGGLIGAVLWGVPGFFLGWLAAAGLLFLLVVGVVGRAANAAGSVYMTSGSSTPAKRQYSQGEALLAQGKIDAAVAEYQRCAREFATDPEPRIRLARLHRDKRSDYEAAAQWFKDALALQSLESGTEIMISRELVELFTHKLGEPRRALPMLAKLSEKHGNSQTGEWARTQIRMIKDHDIRGRS
jgi:tetratricopeptide (TPR) repeat protein